MMDISGIGILAAFLAGAISFLSPCVLPLVPGYVSYIAGQPDLRTTRSVGLRARAGALGLSACFVLGFSTVFVALGAGASMLGSLLLTWRTELNYLGGAIIILFGLVMLGVFRLEAFSRDTRFTLDIPGGRPLGAYVSGTGLRLRLDTLHRTDPRRDPDAQFDLRRYVGRHLAAFDLFRRSGRPLPAGGAVHRRHRRTGQTDRQGRALAL